MNKSAVNQSPAVRRGFLTVWPLVGLLPLAVVLALWQSSVSFHTGTGGGWLNLALMPAPKLVAASLWAELLGQRLWLDILTSLARLSLGLLLTVGVGAPVGLWLGQNRLARSVLLPSVNVLRTLSPLAWMPFVVLFAGVGGQATIALLFLACAPTMIVGTAQAAMCIPKRFYEIAHLHQMTAWQQFWNITLPGSLRGLVETLRLTVAVGWIVLVAGEMVAGQDGLGFAIMDARNGLRYDLVLVYMAIIGVLGYGLDRLCFSSDCREVR